MYKKEGALSDPAERKAAPKEDKVVFYRRWCKKCALCAAFCPREALTLNKEGYPELTYPERCTSCGLCEVRCPDFAINVPLRHRKRREK